jgi:hypothetical protein
VTFDVTEGNYVHYHREYWRQVGDLRRWLDAAFPAVQRLERLNALAALGAPVMGRGIDEFNRLAQYAVGCPIIGPLEAELEGADACPVCGIAYGAPPPERRVRTVLRAIHGGLRYQVRRLAGEPVRSRLGGSEQAIERLFQALRSGNPAATLLVLDDELIAELERALDPDSAPRGVLEQVQRLHPVVRDWEIDTAVETFRRLLITAIDAADRRGEPAEVRLLPDDATER